MSLDTEFQEVIQAQGVYRPAFPSYRVFIFGQEVTGDVVEVRISQAGGSVERSAGGCSFTLVNKYDKYTITHNDMKVIGSHRNVYIQALDARVKQTLADDSYAFDNENSTLLKVLENYVVDGADVVLDDSYNELLDAAKKDGGIDYENSVVPLFVKSEVVGRKQTFKYSSEMRNDTGLPFTYERYLIWDYPYQEGDCIFHFNDPVRIAFRDPFNPQAWLWMFAGFVDSFTENSGTNKESMLSITCTDVSKLPRYSLVQGFGYLENGQESNPGVDKVGIQIYKDIYADMYVHEILENIFFGADSYLGTLTPFVTALVAQMNENEIKEYLVKTLNYSPEKMKSIFVGSESDVEWARRFVEVDMVDRRNLLVSGVKNTGGIIGPHGEKFKRRSDAFGVTAYFFGDLDDVDAAIGTEINSLYEWNRILYHQVQVSDLRDMAKDDIGPVTSPELSDISNVIYIIGTDLINYPVGGGRVFYFAPAKLATLLGTHALDKEISTGVSAYSPLVDRLTLIYDVAERMDFRFYATPKGDLVFEMPFYDFDPQAFTKKTSLGLMDLDQDNAVKKLVDRYDEIYKTGYTGNYDVAVAEQLTSLALRAEEVGSNLYVGVVPDLLAEGFIIEPHEQISFSHTATDDGAVTVSRCTTRSLSQAYQSVTTIQAVPQYAINESLIPTLGKRVVDSGMNGLLNTPEGSLLNAYITMNKHNAEMRNVGIQTTPKFNFMVNRPVFWRARNFYGNIVSATHSIVWNSGCESSVNLNQLRGWGGETDENGYPIHRHFSNTHRPYDLSSILEFNKRAWDQRSGK